jgi:aryl-alcohol dehydrogenase-like predicted oxidoreductase
MVRLACKEESRAIPQRDLGIVKLRVSALGLGCMGMSEWYGVRDDKEAIATIHRALDLGVNFLDTADIYGMGENERLIGRAIKGRRHEAIVATKFGNIRDGSGNFVTVNGHPDYVRDACEASLRRLDLDVIDLYYQHRVDNSTPIEDTVGAMARLVEQGKVRFIGLSEAGSATIRHAHRVHPVTALQSEYSLWTRDPENDVMDVCRELGIGFVAYAPLGRGFLTGRLTHREQLEVGDSRRQSPRFAPQNFDQNLNLLDQLEQIARENGCTLAQLALAWLLAQGADIVPVPGTKRRAYLEENIGALSIKLTEDDLLRINDVAPLGVAAGARYSEKFMKLVNL